MKKMICFTLWFAILFCLGCAAEYDQKQVETPPTPAPPSWAIVHGYHPGIYYYYFPDWEIYYDIALGTWIYYDGMVWIASPVLPPWCAHINLFTSYKVTLDYKGKRPYLLHKTYRIKYPAKHFYDLKRPAKHQGKVFKEQDQRKSSLVPRNLPEREGRMKLKEKDAHPQKSHPSSHKK